MKKIENVLKLIPLFSFLLIVASSVKLAIFYKFFSINIIEYLTISEYIPLFLDDLHGILYFGSSIMLGIVFSNSDKEIKEASEKKKEEKSLKIAHIVYVILFGIVAPIFLYYKYETWYERLGPVNILFFVLMTSIALLYLLYKKRLITRHVIFFIFILLSVPVVVSAHREVYKIVEEKRKTDYEIKINGKIIGLNVNETYLGKSSEFIFFYNFCTKTSSVFPMSQVEEIKIIKNKK